MTDKKLPASLLELTAVNPAARIDPHGVLKPLREQSPVMRDEASKVWLLTRYSDIRETVNNHDHLRSPYAAEVGSLGRRLIEDSDHKGARTQSILMLDNPDHARVRLPLMKAFYARIQAMKDEIEALIDEIIDAAPQSGEFDLMTEIAVPVPILVIARILGVDESRIEEFRAWSEASILVLNPVRTPAQTEEMLAGSEALADYFTELIEARRKAPKEDLISDVVQLQAAGADISDEELRTNLSGLLIGGNLTTTDLIGNGVWLFLNHPEELAKLKADPSLASAAVEEVLRYESPVGSTSRTLESDQTVGGCPMKTSQVVYCSLHSANRDPDKFERPDEFDITRKHVSHIAFGGGAHICIGAPLARIEARRVFIKLFSRYPNLQLAETEIPWRALPFFRGIERLTIRADG